MVLKKMYTTRRVNKFFPGKFVVANSEMNGTNWFKSLQLLAKPNLDFDARETYLLKVPILLCRYIYIIYSSTTCVMRKRSLQFEIFCVKRTFALHSVF